MTPMTTAQQLSTSADSFPRPCVIDHGYAWLAAGAVGTDGFPTVEANTKRPTRRLSRALT